MYDTILKLISNIHNIYYINSLITPEVCIYININIYINLI